MSENPEPPLLSAWCEALSAQFDGDGPKSVDLMEGPYVVEVGPIRSQQVHLELVEEGSRGRVTFEGEVDLKPLVRSVLSAADRALRECRSRGWWSADERSLLEASSALRAKLGEH